MKKGCAILWGLLIVIILAACSNSTSDTQVNEKQPVMSKYSVELEFECVANLIFSRYDIDIFVDGGKIGKLDHGATRAYSIELEEGAHTLVAAKEGSSSVDGTIDFQVSENTKLKYKFACKSNQVEIEEIIEETKGEAETVDITVSDNLKTSLRTVSCFDPNTNKEIVFNGLRFSIPAHFDCLKDGASESEAEYYPSEEICYCSLVFSEKKLDCTKEQFDNYYKDSTADNFLQLLKEDDDRKILPILSEAVVVAGLSGWTISFVSEEADNPSNQSMVYYTFVYNPHNSKLIFILQAYGSDDESSYDYVGDYNKILQSAVLVADENNQPDTAIDTNESAQDVPDSKGNSNALYYSTNDRQTAKKGNTGVFSYSSSGKNYNVYWIIDFDEGYVYYFLDGDGNTTCDRLKIESGDLNDVLIITYHDGDDEWSYGLHFKWKSLPDILIMQDNDGFEYKYSPTDLKEALKKRESKTIKDY